ncbi:hypothetical protein EVAR_40626_1 [Eumeta japonica]|uniref:Uncharacterized protein n=1 Tax=Eumeta variegata TaxID=151549 RepID=A0A4C1X6V3_EUMVA|nr:hypothetical protein EVAR_40626_1 [Eumeta japonica]
MTGARAAPAAVCTAAVAFRAVWENQRKVRAYVSRPIRHVSILEMIMLPPAGRSGAPRRPRAAKLKQYHTHNYNFLTTIRQRLDEQRRPRTPATPGESLVRCRPFKKEYVLFLKTPLSSSIGNIVDSRSFQAFTARARKSCMKCTANGRLVDRATNQEWAAGALLTTSFGPCRLRMSKAMGASVTLRDVPAPGYTNELHRRRCLSDSLKESLPRQAVTRRQRHRAVRPRPVKLRQLSSFVLTAKPNPPFSSGERL